MKQNVFGRIYKHRRVWAILMALLMVASIIMVPGDDRGKVRAISDGYTNDLQYYLTEVPSIEVHDKATNTWTKVSDPNVVYDGSTIKINLNYSLPTNLFQEGDWDPATNTATSSMTFTYPLPGNIAFTSDSQKEGMSGIVKSTTLPDAGTYEIVKEGDKYVVKITFNRLVYEYNTGTKYDEATKSFVDATAEHEAQDIDGDFQFQCEADLEDDQTSLVYEFPGKSDSTKITVIPNSDAYDLRTAKTTTDNEDGTYTHTITISSEKGTGGKITVSDDLGQYYAVPTNAVTVSGPNGYSDNIAASSLDTSGTTFSLPDGLPALKAGEEYTITYTTSLNDTAKQTNGWLNLVNTVTATSKDNDDKIISSHGATSSMGFTHNLISKSGSQPDDAGYITYTVTINEAHEDLENVTIKDILNLPTNEAAGNSTIDDLLSNISDITITATDRSGASVASPTLTETNINSSGFFGYQINGVTKSEPAGYKFTTSDTNTYVITYKYKMQEIITDNDRSFNNTAYYNNKPAYGNVGVKGAVYQDKTNGNVQVTDDGLNITWTITIQNPTNADIAEGSYTIDEFSGTDNSYQQGSVKHYLTSAISDLPPNVKDVIYYNASGGEMSADTISPTNPAYKVKFIYKEIPAKTSAGMTRFKITYTTFAPYEIDGNPNVVKGDENKYYYFYNTAKYYDKDDNSKGNKQTNAQYQYKKVFTKYAQQNSPITYSEGLQLKYKIEVELNKDFSEDYLVIEDALPKNTTLDESSAWLQLHWWENIRNVSEYSADDFIVNYDEDGGKVTFKISKKVMQNEATSGSGNIVIYYALNIPEEATDDAVKGLETFENTASGGGDTTTVVQQVVYPDRQAEHALTKNDPTTDITNNTAKYSVLVNTDGVDLDPGSSDIELVDKLTAPDECLTGITIDRSDIKVYNYDATADNNLGDELSSTAYSYTQMDGVENGEVYSTLTFKLPDKTPLVVVYTYHFVFSDQTKLDDNGNPYVPITNIANLTGGYSDENSEYHYRVTSSSASAVVHPTMTLYKTSTEDLYNHLDGAVFSLQRFDMTSKSFVDAAVSSFTVPSAGLKLDSNLKEDGEETYNDTSKTIKIRPHTLYKLEETTAPTGYKKSDEPIYMIFGNQDSSVGALITYMTETIETSGVPLSKIKLVSVNQAYPIQNEPYDDTYLSVKKIWKNAAGVEYATDAEAIANKTAKIQLYRVPIESTHYKVTINIIKNDDIVETQKILYVKQDSTITVNFGSHLDTNTSTNMDISINGIVSDTLEPIAVNSTVSKTFGIYGDTVIELSHEGGTWKTPTIKSVEYDKPDSGSIVAGAENKVGDVIELTAGNSWQHQFSNLDVEDTQGRVYYYYVVEEDAEGYITTYAVTPGSDYDIGYTNNYSDSNHQYSLLKGELSVTNQEAGNNKGKLLVTKTIDGTYSGAATFPITVTLRDNSGNLLSGTNSYGGHSFSNGVFTISISQGETIEFTDIPYGYSYTVTEGNATADAAGFYKKEIIDSGTGKITTDTQTVTVKNYYSEATSITVEKKWVDKDESSRPTEIKVQLYQKIGSAASVAYLSPATLKSTDSPAWSHTWGDLPTKDSNGNDITYSVQEVGVSTGYTLTSTERSDNTFTLTNTADTTSCKVIKKWNDNNNKAGVRPTNINVSLKGTIDNNGTKEDVPLSTTFNITIDKTLSPGDEWSDEWTGLPIYYKGKKITYTVVENTSTLPMGYTAGDPVSSDSGKTITITNNYTMEKTSLNVKKVWDDASNTTNRPAEITVQLYKKVGTGDEEPVTGKTLKLTSIDGWADKSWTELDTKEDGQDVTYSAREVGTCTGYIAPTYEKDITTNTVTITNKLAVGTSLTVKKTWDDNNNQDGKRPGELAVKLTADAGGTLSDADMIAAGIATDKINVTLKATDNWTYTWDNLPAYINRKRVTYDVSEPAAPDGYMLTGATTSGQTVTLVNSHTTEKVTKKVKKIWDNPLHQPAKSSITVKLVKNGEVVEGSDRILTGNADPDKAWTAEWTDLDKCEDGEEINYSVEEVDNINGYGWSVEKDTTDATGNTLLLYNSLPRVNTRIRINKTWADENDQDGIRPTSVTYTLLANGIPVAGTTEAPNPQTFVVSKTDTSRTYEWKGLMVYMTNDSDTPIDYTIIETVSDGYTASTVERAISSEPDVYGIYTTDFTLTNTHTPETTKITAKKVWNDSSDTSHRPSTVIIGLYKTVEGNAEALVEEKTLNSAVANGDSQQYVWDNLLVYDNGKKITYRVDEVTVPSEYSKYRQEETSSDGKETTVTITNSCPAARMISVEKQWDDANNQDGLRPDKIKVHLFADNVEKDTAELTAANEWKVTWGNLPVETTPGTPINYRVTEDTVAGYNSVIDTTNFAATDASKGEIVITNTHTPELTELTVNKIWVDSLDPSRRPSSVKVQLCADGELQPGTIITLTPDSNGDWSGGWTNLPLYNNGEKITYTAKELNVPAGYTSTGALDSAGNTYTITNTRTVPTSVTFSKRSITGTRELPGAVLKIVDSNGNTVLDEDGNPMEWTSGTTPHTVSGFEVNAEYTLIEDTAPAGYAVIVNTSFKINTNGKVELTGGDEHVSTSGDRTVIINDQFTSVKVSKVDITSGDELEGAHIQIIDENGDVVEEWDSTKEAHEITRLTAGKKYILRETVAPLGYTIATDTTFMLDKDGKVINDTSGVTTADVSGSDGNLLLVKDGLTKLNFTKVGIINETCAAEPGAVAPIPGAKFAVYPVDANGKISDTDSGTSTSNSDGIVVFEGLLPGKYAVKELSVPEPYILDTTVYYATVPDKVDKNFEGLRDEQGKLLTANRLVNDQYRADISLMKVSEYNQSEVLANSTYGLYKLDSLGEEALVATNTTDQDGKLTFEGVLTGVEYKVREMVSPDGYYVSKNPISISFKVEDGKAVLSAVDNGSGTATIDENGNITWLEPSVVVKFAKTDSKGKMLAGAKLTVQDSDGNAVTGKDGKKLEWTSTKSAYEVEGVFEVGKTYYLVETKAPKGYKKAAKVAFTIPDETVGVNENKIVSVTMVDDKKSTSKKSSSSTSKKSGSSTKTGDTSAVRYAGILMLISLLAGSLLTVYSYKKREDD